MVYEGQARDCLTKISNGPESIVLSTLPHLMHPRGMANRATDSTIQMPRHRLSRP